MILSELRSLCSYRLMRVAREPHVPHRIILIFCFYIFFLSSIVSSTINVEAQIMLIRNPTAVGESKSTREVIHDTIICKIRNCR